MRKYYDGLSAVRISLAGNNVIATSTTCTAMIQLKLVDGVCTSPSEHQQIEYVGDQG